MSKDKGKAALERTAAMPLDAAAQDKLRRAIRRWEGVAAQRRDTLQGGPEERGRAEPAGAPRPADSP